MTASIGFLLRSAALLAALCCVALPMRAADPPPKEDTQSRKIFVEGTNQTPSWMVRVDVDNPDRVYHEKEQIVVKVVSEKDGYLYLFNIDPAGEIDCLFPNHVHSDNAIKAGQKIVVGSDRFRFKVGPPTGKELIKAIVTKAPLTAAKPEDLIDSKKAEPKQLSPEISKKLMVEAITGDPMLGDSQDSVEKIRDKFQQTSGEQFAKRQQEYAEHQIEITTIGDKEEFKPQEKRVGVFIGIDDFKDSQIRKLASSHHDAEAMEKAMKSTGKFNQTYLLTNKDATLAKVRDHITKKLLQDTRPGDTVLIYWSGHGGRCANTDGTEPDGFDMFLVPYDGQLTSNASVRKTMLLDKTFARWVQELDGRKVMVILDTCHSGGHASMTKGLKEEKESAIKGVFIKGEEDKVVKNWSKRHFLETEIARAKGIGQKDAAVLASSTAKQVSFERRERDYSVMTYYILEMLQDKNAGAMTLEDVYKGTREKVKKYVEEQFDGTTQTPVFSGQLIAPAPLFKP
jgi:uncharacterized caspase-like protein